MVFDKWKKKILKGRSYGVGVKFVDRTLKNKRLLELQKSLCKKCRRKAKKVMVRGKSMDVGDDFYCVVCTPIMLECGRIALEIKKVAD